MAPIKRGNSKIRVNIGIYEYIIALFRGRVPAVGANGADDAGALLHHVIVCHIVSAYNDSMKTWAERQPGLFYLLSTGIG
jgi:hypothetical protein